MRKVIALAIVFALAATAAFAQPTIGGQLLIGTQLISGNSDADDIYMGGMIAHEAKISASFGDSTAGGVLVLSASGDHVGRSPLFDIDNMSGFMYWRPSQFFRMQVGQNNDGDFGAARISGWGFTAEAKNSVAAMNDYMDWYSAPFFFYQFQRESHSAFYPGTGDTPNLNMSFFPVDGLRINFVLPMEDGFEEISAGFAPFHFNLNYDFESIGLLNLSFQGRGGLETDSPANVSVGDIYLSFFLSALDGMDVDLGFRFSLPAENDDTKGMALGLGFTFAADDFNFKLRAGANFGGKRDGGNTDLPTIIGFNILPSYRIGVLTANLYAGFGIELDDGDTVMDWFVNPYISMPAGSLRFYAGVQVWQRNITDGSDTPVNFSIPFGFNIYF
jgi:hypothetical protein